MTPNKDNLKKELKQRLTVFVDPNLVKRAKIQAALKELTISEVIEKAIDIYAPKIEKNNNQLKIYKTQTLSSKKLE